jgi:uncharacterized membrane-anchored protein/uncharacterized membrane protein
MRNNIQLGYVLGSSSLMSALVYFYASNWGALSRWEKFVPLFICMVGLYGLSVLLSKRPGREFLSRLSLFSSCLCFGIGIALIDQTYNSHADSYRLFGIWLLPSLLFAILTRWQPFYVLSYILGHLTYLMYFFPDGTDVHSEWMTISLLFILAILNLALYVITVKKYLTSPTIKFISFSVAIGIFLLLSNSLQFEQYGWIFNFPLIALLAAGITYFHRNKDKMYLLLSGLWVSICAIAKYTELAVHYFDEAFIYMGMVFVVLFIWGNVRFLKYIRAFVPSGDMEEQAQKERSTYIKWVTRVLTAAVIMIGTILGTVTLVGFVFLIVDMNNPEYLFAFVGVIAVAATIAARNLNSIVRYTLMTVGLAVGVGASIYMDSLFLLLLFLALVIVAFIFIAGTVQRVYFFLSGTIILGIILIKLIDKVVLEFTVLGVILALICIGSSLFLSNPDWKKPLLYSGYPSFLLVFFILTFITEDAVYYVCNALFFLTVTYFTVKSKQASVKWMYSISLGFWIAYVVYKYYDTAWKLLHKSVSLALIGILFILVTLWVERRSAIKTPTHSTTTGTTRNLLIAALVVLQVVSMSAQITKSEQLLANGQLIKLQLVPYDPRSLLQGDYVRLQYTISEPDLSDGMKESFIFQSKASIVIGPDPQGVYQYKRIYENGEALQQGEVRINGRWNGYDGFVYGIETYFVPEGTGLEVERNAKFAEVKVSASGDAILVRLLDQ